MLATALGAALPAWAADIHWKGGTAWQNSASWLEGVVPGAADRAVFDLAGAGFTVTRASIAGNLGEVDIGSVLITNTSSTIQLGVNNSHPTVRLHGLGGVGAQNDGSNMVNFFFYSELMGDQSIRATNAAGGGFLFSSRISTVPPLPRGLNIGAHTVTFDTVHATNVIRFGGASVGVTGTGSVVKTGLGRLEMTGSAAVNNYTGSTSILAGTLALTGVGSIASSSNVRVDGTFDISGTTAGATINTLTGNGTIELGARDLRLAQGGNVFSGVIKGGGGLTLDQGLTTLSGANTYAGATNIASGTLRAGAANTLSAASAHTVATGTTLDLAGFSQTVAALNNSGTVALSGGAPGSATVLTVNGPYSGSNGVLKLGTTLGGSGGVSDRLVLDGPAAIASGKTTMQITNLGGLGALTTGNGIEVISAINGATTTAQTTKDAFALAGGHVDAGAYEYRLYAADSNGAGESWYLRSTTDAPSVTPASGTDIPLYRVEVPLLASVSSQVRQGSLAMLGNLHQRLGDNNSKGTDAAPDTGSRRAWARGISTDLNIHQGGAVSPESDGRLHGLQAGTDLFASPNGRVGVYVGQLEGSMGVSGFARGVERLSVGSNQLRGEYAGIYGTWTSDSGLYADAVLQAGRHRYTARPVDASGIKGKGDSLLASIEAGYAFPLGAGWRIEPQLQLIHQRLDMDDVTITGAQVRQDSDSGWVARAGVRIKGEFVTGIGTLQPYGRLNMYRLAGGSDVARFIGPAGSADIASRTGSTSTELAVGLALAVSPRIGLYGELGKLWASGGDARVKGSLQASLGGRILW